MIETIHESEQIQPWIETKILSEWMFSELNTLASTSSTYFSPIKRILFVEAFIVAYSRCEAMHWNWKKQQNFKKAFLRRILAFNRYANFPPIFG